MPWKRLFHFVGLVLAAAPSPASADTTNRVNSERTGFVQREGHDLCKAILQAYNRETTSSHRDLQVSDFDITPVVSEYIEPGMSFDRAEQILRAAGLNVSGRPGPEGWNGNRTDKFAVSAYSYEYFNRSPIYRFFRPLYKDYSRKLFITLFPERPSDYDKVAKVTAMVSFSSL